VFVLFQDEEQSSAILQSFSSALKITVKKT
jgi:hypothetical protein